MSAENWGWSIGSILYEYSVVLIMQKKHNIVTSVIKKLIAHALPLGCPDVCQSLHIFVTFLPLSVAFLTGYFWSDC